MGRAGISFSYTDCGTAGTHGKVTGLDVQPSSPVPGDNITITATVQIDKNTTKIKSDLVFARLFHNKFDGCAGATIKAPLGVATVIIPPPGCPLKAGTTKFVRYVQTRAGMVKGSTTSHLEGTDQDGEPFICVDMTLTNKVEAESHFLPPWVKDVEELLCQEAKKGDHEHQAVAFACNKIAKKLPAVPEATCEQVAKMAWDKAVQKCPGVIVVPKMEQNEIPNPAKEIEELLCKELKKGGTEQQTIDSVCKELATRTKPGVPKPVCEMIGKKVWGTVEKKCPKINSDLFIV